MKALCAQNGKAFLKEKDRPNITDRQVLVETKYSAISPGTELSMTENSKNQINLGYSASGVIVEVGKKIEKFKVGDRVAVYGAPYVGHREYLAVPETLVAKVPKNVSLEDASMAGIGAIAIHALRQAELQFGEIVVVVGLGIYGQLISQIAKNSGLVVLPLNRSEPRVKLLESTSSINGYYDEQQMEQQLKKLSEGNGADAVLLCAGGKVSPLTNKSFRWLRDRGTSVIVGDIEPNYDRSLMFSKELNIKISRAGGPGRYDTSYEKDAVDYPYGYVRWTEGRNVKEFIRLLDENRISVSEYYDTPVPITEFEAAYQTLSSPGAKKLTYIFKY